MGSLEQFIEALTDRTARLDAELRELNGLRERVRKAQQEPVGRSGQTRKREAGSVPEKYAPPLLVPERYGRIGPRGPSGR
jgi:hypothetical protein